MVTAFFKTKLVCEEYFNTFDRNIFRKNTSIHLIEKFSERILQYIEIFLEIFV